jgi:hypothetical protein
MKNIAALLIYTGLISHSVAGALSADGIQSLGKMNGFYRYTAVLGPQLEGGYQVTAIPEWMQETDFAYRKRPYEKEIPFADGLSMVRLLSASKTAEDANKPGGTMDLVYRNSSGQLQYRWDVLKARLDPYINLGYTDLTLVMDNIPWCFPSVPIIGEYGQMGAPADYQEWYAFIKAMCAELKRLYGEEPVKHFRFRMGTEMQDARRWTGSYEGYLQYYDLAAKAVQEEIPGAGFGPFNRSVPQKGEAVSIVELAKHCARNNVPFDFMPRSFYYFSSQPKPGVFGNIHPDQRINELETLWEQIEQMDPKYKNLSREVHEFGPHLSTEEGLYGFDTGARGAAQTFHTVVQLREAGTDRLWHWQLFEKIEPGRELLYSTGWLYSVFDYLRGGEAFVLPVQSAADNGNAHKALLTVLEDRAILIVSCWNTDRVKHAPDQLTLRLPESVLSKKIGTVKTLSFTETNSVYDVVRRDLAAADLLSEKHKKHRGAPATSVIESGYDRMAADKKTGAQFVSKDWDKYEKLMRNALKLSGFNGTVTKKSGGIEVLFEAANPSVTVIVMNFEK